jgi:hypothetical protein
MACMADKISASEVEPLALGIVAWHKQLCRLPVTPLSFSVTAPLPMMSPRRT